MSLVTGSCITKRVKRLVSNEIELGMEIPPIESRQVTYLWTMGIAYWINWILDIMVQPIKIFIEYVGTNMGI